MNKMYFRSFFIDPTVLSMLPTCATVYDDKVIIRDSEIEIYIPHPYTDGDEVYVFMDGNHIWCKHMDEIAEEEDKQSEKFEDELYRILCEAARQSDIEAFNRSLNIPVQWVPEIKHVLGGLTERSYGNGMNNRSVIHVMLMEDLHDGRLHREADQPLCGGTMGSFSELSVDHYPEMRVTCKKCLNIAERWR